MNKIITLAALLVFITGSTDAQVGKFLKSVKNSVQQEILGTPAKDTPKSAPEPPSACDNAELVFETGKYKLDYSELNISVLDDGRILLYDKIEQNYYIVKGGVTEGPLKDNDARLKDFRSFTGETGEKRPPEEIYSGYVSRKGDKYVINFGGKAYGPYARIEQFVVSSAGGKFAAKVVENVAVTEEEGKKMDEAINNAKTEQEKTELAMQYAQLMQQRVLNSGGPTSIIPKLITNIPGASVNQTALMTGTLNNKMKYDEILFISGNTISDLTGKKIMNLDPQIAYGNAVFISSDNSRYATYTYGTLTISDGKKIAEMFNPHLVKQDGQIFLAYMYYSPKRSAIMQCKVPY